jgi:phage protein D
LDDNINVDQPSFLVRATNNTVTATINVYVQKVDQKDTIVVTSNINPSGIV